MAENLRPCRVDGTKALFHRWVDKDRVIVGYPDTILGKMGSDCMANHTKTFLDISVFPPVMDKATVIKDIFALVEYEDGTVDMVEVNRIQFQDGEHLFYDNKIYFYRKGE